MRNRHKLTPSQKQLLDAYGKIKQVKKTPKRQQETLDQKSYIEVLNGLGIGFFWRVKSMGTWDPRGFYRKNRDTTGIPDICGYLYKSGTAVFIECKRVLKVEKKRKLLFKVKISDEQVDFLYKAYKAGCVVGVAFTLDDVLGIVKPDPVRRLRHPRTYCFMDQAFLAQYEAYYVEKRTENSKLLADPVYRDVTGD